MTARDGLRERGFVIVKQLLDEHTVESAIRELERLSGRRREDFASGRGAPLGLLRGLARAWTLPDGVSKVRALWPLILDDGLVSAVRAMLGPKACFLQHTDLHVGFSAVTWHRDSVDRRLLGGPDWDEADEPYRILRVAFYLQGFSESRFALGLLPGTHRPDASSPERAAIERAAGAASQALRLLTRRDPLAARAKWVATEPGDAVVFDPRVLHAGSPVAGAKYSLFLAYGVPGRHFARHQAYYRHVRAELGYADLDPDLVARLRGAGLYAEGLPEPKPAPSWRPSWLRTLAARRIRPASPGRRSAATSNR